MDVDLGDEKMTEELFKQLEKEVWRIVNQKYAFEKQEISVDEARKLFESNEYKQEWLDEIAKKGEPATLYYTARGTEDEFVDLCAGPHVENTGQIGFFKLLTVAGAYWHGDEKNKMLTRIYGTTFPSKQELNKYLQMLEEAKKNDHRKLGKDLDLFVFSDLVGKGLPLLTPKGSTIRRELERFIVDEEIKRGYEHVYTPPLAKVDLYKTSGHYPYYKDTMYPIMQVEDEELILRPMTCPHHFMLYKSRPHSYKELPIRYGEMSPQFRFEKSGELSGLMRVRVFTLADAHIFCTLDQAEAEVKDVIDLIEFINQTLGLKKGEDYLYRLSLGNRSDDKKFFKDDEAWDKAEQILRKVLKESQAPFYEAPGEAAFYGPKIDVQIKKINGVEETAFTVQCDFAMPGRFDLKYIDTDGSEKQPIVIHRASMGAMERTLAFLIEFYGGAFPLWLSPTQVSIIPISEKFNDYGKKIEDKLRQSSIRVELNNSEESMQKRIRNAEKQKVPYMLVVGEKEQNEDIVAVRARGRQDLGVMKLDEFLDKIKEEIEEKKCH
jgi:threonyl-tRNA synthetase